jgi:hypothetical protein
MKKPEGREYLRSLYVKGTKGIESETTDPENAPRGMFNVGEGVDSVLEKSNLKLSDIINITGMSALPKLDSCKITKSETEMGVLCAIAKSPQIERTVRKLHFDEKTGQLTKIQNYELQLNKELQGQGIATQILLKQAPHVFNAGVDTITCEAARIDSIGVVGYYVWPLLGFDGDIPP